MIAVSRVAAVLPDQRAHINVSHFSIRPIRLPKHVAIPYVNEPPPTSDKIRKDFQKLSSEGTPRKQ